jgi:leucyl aminopeptidase
MEFTVKSGTIDKLHSGCVIAGIYESGVLTPSAAQLDQVSNGYISKLVKRGDLSGKAGKAVLLQGMHHVAAERILLVGMGKQGETTDKVFRDSVTAAIKLVNESAAKDAALFLTEVELKERDDAWKARQIIETANSALYSFDELKSEKPKQPSLLKKGAIVLTSRKGAAAVEKAVNQGNAIAHGVKLAKDLSNLPGNICTPTYLGNQAKSLGRKHKKLSVQVLSEAEMQKLGMGSLLSVSRGSRQPAKLIVMKYSGGAKSEKPVVLVGKGLTFDSGGVSLKPGPQMDEMKYDMCGAASVFGTVQAAAELDLPINLIGVIPSSENMPDGDANKPGDIVTSMSGQTIEILNTDAEGRLILCDALTYSERFKPDVVIDIATLTGACVIALGSQASGLMANDQSLADKLLEAGQATGDRAWQLPIWEEYQEQLNSPFADMQNIGGKEAGSITAACFLARFTKKFTWAHLDIAGTAWKSGATKGGTGRPVALLTQYLLNRCK